MSDVNERIVQRYFELEGYMVTTNLKYMIKKQKSAGESDIDLAISRENPLDRAIVEVKGWHTETFSKSYFTCRDQKDYRFRVFHFVRPEALKAAQAFFKTKIFRKILVVPRLSLRDKDKIKRYVKEKYDIDILEFYPILKKIVDKTEVNKNYRDNDFQQTIRLLKSYEFLKGS
jgi:hypothetical protein